MAKAAYLGVQEEQGRHADVHPERKGGKQEHNAEGDQVIFHGHLPEL